MTVESSLHSHCFDERVNRIEPVRVASRSFVAYQYIRTLT